MNSKIKVVLKLIDFVDRLTDSERILQKLMILESVDGWINE